MKSIIKLPQIIFLLFVINLSACSNSKVTKLSGVDAYVSTVKLGCIPDIAGESPLRNFVVRLNGGPIRDEFKKHFLFERQGFAYAIPHPDHQLVVTSTENGLACNAIVRRIDVTQAMQEMENMLFDLGFSVTEPTEYTKSGITTGYTKGDIGVVVSYSLNKAESRNFDSITTVLKKKPGHIYDHNNSL